MIYAQIKNGIIENTILIDNVNLVPLFQNNLITNEPYDYVIRVCGKNPQPGIGWLYDGTTFTSPPQPEEEE